MPCKTHTIATYQQGDVDVVGKQYRMLDRATTTSREIMQSRADILILVFLSCYDRDVLSKHSMSNTPSVNVPCAAAYSTH